MPLTTPPLQEATKSRNRTGSLTARPERVVLSADGTSAGGADGGTVATAGGMAAEVFAVVDVDDGNNNGGGRVSGGASLVAIS